MGCGAGGSPAAHGPPSVRGRRAAGPACSARIGAVLQIDVMSLKPHTDVRFKQFTAVDVASRYLAGRLYRRATARHAEDFLRRTLARLPFPVGCVQVDGGSGFRAEFEAACGRLKLPLVVLPPASPKMNTRVEYVHGTCRREFYECFDLAPDLAAARRQWRKWEDIYNRIRPHQSLAMKTPMECISEKLPSAKDPSMC